MWCFNLSENERVKLRVTKSVTLFCPCRWIPPNIFGVLCVLTQWVQIKTELSIRGGDCPDVGGRDRSSEAWCGLPQLCGHKEMQRGARGRPALTDAGQEARVRNRRGVTESSFQHENWFVQEEEEEEFGRPPPFDLSFSLLPEEGFYLSVVHSCTEQNLHFIFLIPLCLIQQSYFVNSTIV